MVPPKTDMVNEEVGGDNKAGEVFEDGNGEKSLIVVSTANRKASLSIRAFPLPEEATRVLEDGADILKTFYEGESSSLSPSEATLRARDELRQKLGDALAGHSDLARAESSLWSVGPRKNGPNILVNRIPHYKNRPSLWEWGSKKASSSSSSPATEFDSSIVNGFQLATLAGPLCEEPMMGVAFVVEDFALQDAEEREGEDLYGPLSGQVVSAAKEGCRKAFQVTWRLKSVM